MMKAMAVLIVTIIVVVIVAFFTGKSEDFLRVFGLGSGGGGGGGGAVAVPPHLDPAARDSRSLAIPDFDIKMEGLPADASITLAQQVSDLFPSSHFNVLSRRILEERLRGARIDMKQLREGGGAFVAEFGRKQGVRYVLSGLVERSGSMYALRLRLLSTRSESVIGTASVTAADYDGLVTGAKDAVQKLFDSF
jgi:hypothetical protein